MTDQATNNNKKYYFVLFLFFIALSVGLYILADRPNLIPDNLRQQFLPRGIVSSANINQKATTSQETAEETKPISVKFMAGDKKYETKILPNQTAYFLMEQLKKNNGFSFKAKDFKGIGAFVEEINNVKNNAAKKLYWILYVNGKTAEVGVSQQIIHENDIIEWKYEKSIY